MNRPHYQLAVVLGEGAWMGWIDVYVYIGYRLGKCQVSENYWEKL